MSQLISENAIEKATGQPWNIWLERLEQMGARQLLHKEIATKLVADYQVPGWWAQSLTVRYEQVVGRRQVGQSNDGSFSINVSKTVAGSLNEVMLWWLKKVQSRTDFNGLAIVSSSTTETEKWRHYRVALKDGSRVVVSVYAKSATKASVGLQHDKLASTAAGEVWRQYWKTLFLEA